MTVSHVGSTFRRGVEQGRLGLGVFSVLTVALALWGGDSAGQEVQVWSVSEDELFDRIYGGWVGMLIGGLEGLPHEFKYLEKPREDLPEFSFLAHGARSDDDNDIEWLHLWFMNQTGQLFLPYETIVPIWKANMNQGIWRANKKARELMDQGMMPPATGDPQHNEHAWYNLAGQFCVESYGLVAPGMPQTAARLGLHYARISVSGEPLQAAQYWTTLVSLAFTSQTSVQQLLRDSLAAVDPSSQMAQAIRDALDAYQEYPHDWKAARRQIHEEWREKRGWNDNSVTVNGAAVCLALLYGNDDFYLTLRYAMALGYDADCNAATAGTVVGVRRGFRDIASLPQFAMPDRYENRTRPQLPEQIPVSEQARVIFRLARLAITQNGGSIDISNGRMILHVRCQQPKNVVPLSGQVTAAMAGESPRPTEARPLLVGNWADPSILKDGNDYYMTHSSFEYQPGLLIWHSKDLRTWRPVTHAVVNQEGSIWAPDLVKHNGRYYIYYPGWGTGTNWVVTADAITGPWSKPISLEVGHIDPGHVVDGEGRRYLHLSGGHVVPLTDDGLRVTSPPRKVYEGWPIPADWAIECFCLESPKLTFRNGWYYLTSAQGGTAGPATSHMVVSARSRSALGPWENSPFNPIIRTWSRHERWWSKGHGTLVEGPDGQWFCVLHGYMNGYRTLGRCTLIEPIQWTDDGWFRVADAWPPGWDQPVRHEMPLSDAFDGNQLGIQWQFFRKFEAERFRLAEGRLILEGRGDSPGQSYPLAIMPMHRAYEIETALESQGDGQAGLMLFAGPRVYIGLALGADGVIRRVQEGFQRYGGTDEASLKTRRVRLKIVNEHQDARFYYCVDGQEWKVLQPGMDVSNTGPGFHTLRPALFVTGSAQAAFDEFIYRPLED